DLVGTYDAVARVVGALDEHVRLERVDEGERRFVVEQHDAVYRGKPREYTGTGRLRHDRPLRALTQPPHRRVGVHADDEAGSLAAGGFEQRNVAGVKQIENAVGEDDRAGLAAAPGARIIEDSHLGGGVQRGASA